MITYQYVRLQEAVRMRAPKVFADPYSHTLLDVGCGAGYLLAHARIHGWKVKGIDPWKELAAWGRKYLKVDIRDECLEEAAFESAEADVLSVFDVLTLVPDPVGFLEKCKRALRPGGIIQVSVWNHTDRGDKGDMPGFVLGAHLNAFTPATIRNAMLRAGFRAHETECRTFGDAQEIVVTARSPIPAQVTWRDVADDIDEALRPPLDRASVREAPLTPEQALWRQNGFLILERFIPEDLVDRYCAIRSKIADPVGWHSPSAYEDVEEMRDIALYGPLAQMMEHLIGKPLGLHLVLTGWKSTTRDWHQDDYLNPPEVNTHYMAAWFALDTISPDAGPFEFVPGSHRWPLIRRSKILRLLPMTSEKDESWPWLSEQILTPFFDQEIAVRKARVQQFLGNKGDVLLWHSNLLHRGSLPRNDALLRKSLIAHYTAIGHRYDMHATRRHKEGGTYFDLKTDRGQVADGGGNYS